MLEKRRLAYKDRFVIYLLQVLSDRFDDYPIMPDLPFVDLTTRIPITFNINQEEYTLMYSALSAGAELIFPSISHELRYIFEVPEIGGDMSCDDVADCIDSSDSVALALQNWLSENGYGDGGGTSLPSVYDGNPTLLDPSQITDCDPDILFGMVTQLIDALDEQITSFFALLEAESNGFERAAIIAEAIPGSDQAGFDTAAAGFDQVMEELAENYDANFTPTLRDEYRCDIFCLLKDNCDLDFQMLADYFLGRVGAAISAESFGDAVGWLISGTWIGDQVPDAAFALVLQAIAYAQSVMNMDLDFIVRGIAASLNDPDSDWSILCEDCDEAWCNLFDFTVSQAGFDDSYPSRPYATYLSGQGWGTEQGNVSGVNDNRVYIRRVFTPDFTPEQFDIEYIATAGGANRESTIQGYINNVLVFFHVLADYTADSTIRSLQYTATHTIDEIRFTTTTATGSTPDNDSFICRSIKIEGSTGEPPEMNNC